MGELKPLIGIPSPRNVGIVLEAHEKLKHIPHLWVKYFPEEEAYQIIRNYFLEHKEYNYLIIAPDDLLIEQQHYDSLVSTLEKEDYPVFSGVCNHSMVSEMQDLLAICIDRLPNIVRIRKRHFVFPRYQDVPKGIIQVKFAGFPFMFIRRDIVKQINFDSDRKFNPYRIGRNTGFDLPFCHNCNDLGIPIHVDTNVLMLHLRGAPLSQPYGNQVDDILVGREPKRVYFQQDDQIEDITEQY